MASTTAPIAQVNPARQENPMRNTWRLGMSIFSYIVLILFALAMIFPFIFAVTNSFKTLPDISSNPQLLYPTQGFSDSGYQKIIGANFPRWLFNSFLVAVLVTLGHLMFDSMAGYALARIRFPGRSLAFALLIGTMMVPGIVLLIPRFLVLKQLGLLNSYAGLLMPNLADAFGVFLMKQFYEGIPADLEEAASIDGASRYRMFFTIIFPMAIPALTALAIFGFQGSWNNFLDPLVTVSTEKSLYTLPLGLALLSGSFGNAQQWDLLLAGSVITTLPMAIIFFIFQRFFMEGVTYTGIKGAAYVTQTMQQLGLKNTFILTPLDVGAKSTPTALPQPLVMPKTEADQTSADPDPFSQSTPYDLGWLLSGVYQCAVNGNGPLADSFPGSFTMNECRQMIRVMRANRIGAMIEAGVPLDIPVAHKHGWIDETHGDAGLVTTPGGDYVLTVMMYGKKWLPSSDTFPAIAEISRMTYNTYNPDRLLAETHTKPVPECTLASVDPQLLLDIQSPNLPPIK